MSLSERPRYLPDVNILYALTAKGHVHHCLVREWFYASPSLQWAICAFTESGFLRNTTAVRLGQVSVNQATSILQDLTKHQGYRYLPINADWQTLSSPFYKRIHGTKQVTDAYLLGLAVRAGLVLVTLDKAILHLAGDEFRQHVLLLQETPMRTN